MNQKDGDGPAFAYPETVDADDVIWRPGKLTVRDYACIHLRIPESRQEWLNDLIRKSQADWFVGQAMSGVTTSKEFGDGQPQYLATLAGRAYAMADAMIEARRMPATKTPIDQKTLSLRVRDCLRRLDIETYEQLTAVTGDHLLSRKGFGITSLNDVRTHLWSRNLKLADET